MQVDLDDKEYQKTVAVIKTVYKIQDEEKMGELIGNLCLQNLRLWRMEMAGSAKKNRDKATYDKLKELV